MAPALIAGGTGGREGSAMTPFQVSSSGNWVDSRTIHSLYKTAQEKNHILVEKDHGFGFRHAEFHVVGDTPEEIVSEHFILNNVSKA